jgi:hypothetical protein
VFLLGTVRVPALTPHHKASLVCSTGVLALNAPQFGEDSILPQLSKAMLTENIDEAADNRLG